ncbi:TPA: hypothetical protein ACF2DE_002998 [Clostridium perfringens]
MVRPKKNIEKDVKDIREERLKAKKKEALRKNEIVKKINNASRDITVEVVANVGNFIYQCPSTGILYKIENYGDTELLPYDVFKTMCNRSRKILEKYWIIPIAVYGDDEITLEEVMEVLKIDGIYEEDMFIENNIDDILLGYSAKEISQFLKEYNKNYKDLIIERAVKLAEEGKLSDNTKRLVLKKENKDLEEVFEEIDEKLVERL